MLRRLTSRGSLAAVALVVAAAWVSGQSNYSQPLSTQDQSTGSTAAAVPARAMYVAGDGSGNLTALTVCDKSSQTQMTTATTTQFVALAAGQKIRVCAYQIQGSTTATATSFRFVYGTGANCATGTTNITPAWSLAANGANAQSFINHGMGAGELFQTAAGNALCGTNSAAGTVNIFITYTQY